MVRQQDLLKISNALGYLSITEHRKRGFEVRSKNGGGQQRVMGIAKNRYGVIRYLSSRWCLKREVATLENTLTMKRIICIFCGIMLLGILTKTRNAALVPDNTLQIGIFRLGLPLEKIAATSVVKQSYRFIDDCPNFVKSTNVKKYRFSDRWSTEFLGEGRVSYAGSQRICVESGFSSPQTKKATLFGVGFFVCSLRLTHPRNSRKQVLSLLEFKPFPSFCSNPTETKKASQKCEAFFVIPLGS